MMIRALPPPRSFEGAFSLEVFIAGFSGTEPAMIRRELPLISRLTRKAEVARRLYVAYAPDLRRPASAEILSSSYAAALCGVFLAAAEQGDFRSLNCALKMLDGSLIEPALEPPVMLVSWADRLVA